MYSWVILILIVGLVFSIVVMTDLYHKIQYTTLRDHLRVIWWATMVQWMILLTCIGVLLARHVRVVELGWW